MAQADAVQPDETVEQAARREVREEASIEAIPQGIFSVRHRIDKRGNNLYVVFKCHTDDTCEPVPDGQEVSEARFLTLEEIENLTETWQVNRFVARAVLLGEPHLLTLRGDPEGLGRVYKLFA